MLDFFKAIVQNRRLLFALTINDLKQRYLGNFLGITWAFLQPIMTILIFWFVFQVGFKSQPVDNFPFILWFISGVLPWFFIAEALASGTSSVLDNSFLVKKVVFRTSLLPIVKLLSAFLIHSFFILFMFGMFIYYGYTFDITWLQIAYYVFSSFVLILGLSWITSSIVIFFRDIGQLIGLLLQLGFWITPIFWSLKMIPEKYHWLIELNPVAYIVDGYRNSMIYHKWFWEDMNMTIYFWAVTGTIFILGALIFKKLRPHFADVL